MAEALPSSGDPSLGPALAELLPPRDSPPAPSSYSQTPRYRPVSVRAGWASSAAFCRHGSHPTWRLRTQQAALARAFASAPRGILGHVVSERGETTTTPSKPCALYDGQCRLEMKNCNSRQPTRRALSL
ncbi:hypothetical protein chiPu_0022989 [Chiloscyllium punctatum]|uniref:Uncharacterized protein n=1 Tax=Chiloscyllium punctatum TaxID=137246 RepID=A0A401T885_CHIPU|nr:hypothetical protein [Chiloscyllium punctatum]